MRKKERYEKVIAWFQDNIPVAETELHYNNPYELLIAVILSAQCTDKRVNIITPPLYKRFSDSGSIGCHYAGSDFRIYTKRVLSQQQSQTSGRYGKDAGE